MNTKDVKSTQPQGQKARALIILRRLIWTYFFLLIFEGALRKWVLPFAATPLLLVRDPVVIAAYVVAWRVNLFPRNTFIACAALLGLAMFVVGIAVLGGNIFVPIYGWRSDFLHLPLIFLMGRVLTLRDVQRIGFWVLVIAIPMALLMALQYSSPPNSYINAGSDENFKQLSSAMGHIRAPGTFSFILGPVFYFSLTAAFLLYSQYKSRYPLWLTLPTTLALLLAIAISGSRILLLNIAIVFVIAVVICMFLRPVLALKWIGGLALFILLGLAMSDTPFVQEALQVFSTRVEGASRAEARGGGTSRRVWGDFTDAWGAAQEGADLGLGLGIGTNVGSALLTGKAQFLVAETEWSRIIYESGPFLGGLFLLLRVSILLWLGVVCVKHTVREDPLPLLLFGSCCLGFFNGQWGQSTVLGFAMFCAGLALAAAKRPQSVLNARRAKGMRWLGYGVPVPAEGSPEARAH